VRILAIGRAKKSPETEIFARYAARIKPGLAVQEFDDGHGAPAEIKRREAVLLLGGLAAGDFVVALDAGGATPDSVEFSGLLRRWTETGRKTAFVVGGAEGLDASVIARADAVISLGRLTWPHMLARVMLAEQIYRAQMILSGHPYHRAGRP